MKLKIIFNKHKNLAIAVKMPSTIASKKQIEHFPFHSIAQKKIYCWSRDFQMFDGMVNTLLIYGKYTFW